MSSDKSNTKPICAVPKHIAIIMDGNNRWAKKRFLPSLAGHRAGVASVRTVVRTCIELGVESLTLFAFSSENWRRPKNEVSGLMSLFVRVLKRETSKLKKEGVKLQIIGNRDGLPVDLQALVHESEQSTKECTALKLNVAVNYGGRWDITQAARRIAEAAVRGDLDPATIDEASFHPFTCLHDQAPPDLLIRTGNEQRVSNFLIWQLAYAELYFSPCFWPDFGAKELREAVEDFSLRQRRFGKTSEQVEAERV